MHFQVGGHPVQEGLDTQVAGQHSNNGGALQVAYGIEDLILSSVSIWLSDVNMEIECHVRLLGHL